MEQQENKNYTVPDNTDSRDLSGALKSAQPIVQAPEPSFDDATDPSTPILIRWTMRLSGGLIKNTKLAAFVLISVALVITILSALLIFNTLHAKVPPKPPEFILQKIQQMPVHR